LGAQRGSCAKEPKTSRCFTKGAVKGSGEVAWMMRLAHSLSNSPTPPPISLMSAWYVPSAPQLDSRPAALLLLPPPLLLLLLLLPVPVPSTPW